MTGDSHGISSDGIEAFVVEEKVGKVVWVSLGVLEGQAKMKPVGGEGGLTRRRAAQQGETQVNTEPARGWQWAAVGVRARRSDWGDILKKN